MKIDDSSYFAAALAKWQGNSPSEYENAAEKQALAGQVRPRKTYTAQTKAAVTDTATVVTTLAAIDQMFVTSRHGACHRKASSVLTAFDGALPLKQAVLTELLTGAKDPRGQSHSVSWVACVVKCLIAAGMMVSLHGQGLSRTPLGSQGGKAARRAAVGAWCDFWTRPRYAGLIVPEDYQAALYLAQDRGWLPVDGGYLAKQSRAHLQAYRHAQSVGFAGRHRK